MHRFRKGVCMRNYLLRREKYLFVWAEACQKLQPEKDFGELIAHIRGDILIQEGNEAKKQENPEKAKQCYQQGWDGGYDAAAMAMAVLLSA